MSKLGMHR